MRVCLEKEIKTFDDRLIITTIYYKFFEVYIDNGNPVKSIAKLCVTVDSCG